MITNLLLFAQNLEKTFHLTTDEIVKTKDNQINSIILKFDNTSNDTITGYIKLPIKDGINFLTQENIQVKVNPQKKAFIPIKFTITDSKLTSNDNSLDFKFYDKSTDLEIKNVITRLEIPLKKGTRIFAHSSSSNFNKVGDSIYYEVKVINVGSLPEKIILNSSYRDYLGTLFSENKKITLQPFEDKIVRFSKYVDYNLIKLNQFNPAVTIYNSDGDFAGNLMFTIYNVNSSKSYINPNNNYFNEANFIKVEARGSDLANSTLNLMVHNEFNVGFNEYSYNFNAYGNSNFEDVYVNNAWFDYRRKGLGFRLGNISYGSLEMPVFGRGAIAFKNLNELDNKIVLGVVEQNGNLTDNFVFDNFKKTLSAFVNTGFLIKENELESSVIYQQTKFTKNFILSNEYKWITKHKWNHNIKIGYGNTSTYDNSNSKSSLSLAANVSGNIGEKYSIYSTNYYSTPYYIGNRRGTLILNQRIQRYFKKFSVYGMGIFSVIKPKSIVEEINETVKSNEINSFRAEGGFNLRIFKNLSASIFQRYNTESSYYLTTNYEYSPIKFNSTILGTSFYLNSNSREHQLILNLFGGYYKIDDNSSSKMILSSNLNWSYKEFRVNALIQKGSLDLMEQLNGYNEAFSYNLAFFYRKTFFNSLLNTDFSGYFNYNDKIGSLLSLGIYNYYNIKDKFKITGSVNFNFNQSNGTASKQTYFQLGAQYNLPSNSNEIGKKYGNINAFVYYDVNSNGIYDEGDKIADNRVINVNGVSFITDSEGKITYKKVPYGDHTISLPGQKWFAKDMTINLQSKNMVISIPMHLKGTVRGKLIIESRSKIEHEVGNNLFGVTLEFTDENGVKFDVKTTDRGEFTAFLPIGEYKFHIKEESLPLNVYSEVYSHSVKVDAETNIIYPDIILLIKEKKVNIKRFGAK